MPQSLPDGNVPLAAIDTTNIVHETDRAPFSELFRAFGRAP
jgi:hypothetical protein